MLQLSTSIYYRRVPIITFSITVMLVAKTIDDKNENSKGTVLREIHDGVCLYIAHSDTVDISA